MAKHTHRPPLPHKVLYTIGQHLSQRDLASLSLVSRACHFTATQQLFKSPKLESCSQILKFWLSITRTRHWAKRVESLVIDPYGRPNTTNKIDIKFIATVCLSLIPQCTNLRVLQIKNVYAPGIVPSIWFHLHNLERLCVDFGGNLMKFRCNQELSNLKILSIRNLLSKRFGTRKETIKSFMISVPNIEVFILVKSDVSDEVLDMLFTFWEKLKVVVLVECSEFSGNVLAKWIKQRPDVLVQVVKCPKITYIEEPEDVTDEEVRTVLTRHTTHLEFKDTHFKPLPPTSDGVFQSCTKFLRAFRHNLMHLSFTHCQFLLEPSMIVFENLASQVLTNLVIRGTFPTSRNPLALDVLLEMAPKLVYLDISENVIDRLTHHHLGKIKKYHYALSTLIMENVGMVDDVALMYLSRKCRGLENWVLTNNHHEESLLTKYSDFAVYETIRKLSTLKTVSLTLRNIESARGYAVTSKIVMFHSVAKLSVRIRSSASVAGPVVLALVKLFPNLVKLSLGNIVFTTETEFEWFCEWLPKKCVYLMDVKGVDVRVVGGVRSSVRRKFDDGNWESDDITENDENDNAEHNSISTPKKMAASINVLMRQNGSSKPTSSPSRIKYEWVNVS